MLTTIENLLNRSLPGSPRARQLCAELQGVRLGLDIRGVTRILVQSDGRTLHLTKDIDASATAAEISAGPFSLLALAGPQPEALIQRGEVKISGDTDVAGKYRELARLLSPDLEEELAHAVGDVPAHQAGRWARATLGWTRQAGETAAQNISEYLAHERADLVPRAEGDQFLAGVDGLREDVDRLEARVDRLAPTLAPPKADS